MVYNAQNSAPRATAQNGFTLMELLIAIAILGIILAVAGPALMNRFKQAKINTTKQSLKMVESIIAGFELDLDKLPQSINDLVRRPSASDYYDQEAVESWMEGGYVKGKKIPKDAWGKPFHYRLTPEGEHPYELYSYGPKGRRGKKSARIRLKR